jgi:protein-S-isoprenylcysteine O-methyltransferase Ste14
VNPLVIHTPAARAVFRATVYTWAGAEALLLLRNRAGRSARASRARDPSLPVVGVCLAVGVAVPFALARDDVAVIGGGWLPVVAGVALMICGAAFRLWAMFTLGRRFTFRVEIQHDHRIVTSGPYRYLRHPSYTGLLVGLLGYGVALDSWLSILVAVLAPLVGLLVRIRVEEARLNAALGDEYRRYTARTRRLVPGVW